MGTFMAVGMAVANLWADRLAAAGGGTKGAQWDRPLDTWAPPSVPLSLPLPPLIRQQPWTAGVVALAALLLLWGLLPLLQQPSNKAKHLAAAVASGALFAAGLQRSGMAEQAKVLGFLNFAGKAGWDPSLMVVLGAAVGLLLPPTLWWLGGAKAALATSKAEKVDARLVAGEALFGLGWGLSGLCPGPALCLFAAGAPRIVLAFFPSYLAGWLLVDAVEKGQGPAAVAAGKKGR